MILGITMVIRMIRILRIAITMVGMFMELVIRFVRMDWMIIRMVRMGIRRERNVIYALVPWSE